MNVLDHIILLCPLKVIISPVPFQLNDEARTVVGAMVAKYCRLLGRFRECPGIILPKRFDRYRRLVGEVVASFNDTGRTRFTIGAHLTELYVTDNIVVSIF